MNKLDDVGKRLKKSEKRGKKIALFAIVLIIFSLSFSGYYYYLSKAPKSPRFPVVHLPPIEKRIKYTHWLPGFSACFGKNLTFSGNRSTMFNEVSIFWQRLWSMHHIMEFKETVIWNNTEYGLYEVEIIPVEISANTFSAVINFTYHGDVGEIRKVQVSYRNNYLPKRINNSLDSYPYISPVRNIWNADWLTSLDGKRVNGSYKIAPNGDAVIYSINDSVREVKISTYIHNSVVYSSQPWFPFPVKVDGYIFTPGRILDFSILLNFTLPFAAGHGGTQAPGLPTPMVNLTVDGLTVTLKIVPPYNYTHYYIFWGDNTYEVTTALNLKHHYKVVGNYTVAIFYVYNGTGVVPYFLDTWGQFKFNGWEQSHIWLKEVSLK